MAAAAWRPGEGSSEPRCSPRTEGTAGTQHPRPSHSIPHSYAQGHTGTFSPHGLAHLLHVSAEGLVSGDSSANFSLLPLSRCSLFRPQRNKSPRLRPPFALTFYPFTVQYVSAHRVRDWTWSICLSGFMLN